MLTFINTPAHGFLQVSKYDVIGNGFKPSSFSFYEPETGRMYLEEDCDAPAFLRLAGIDNSQIKEINVDWQHGKNWQRINN